MRDIHDGVEAASLKGAIGRVLLVEDDDVQREGMAQWLRDNGLVVDDCSTVEEAVGKYRDQNILIHLYGKSLILHDTSLFHPVLYFYFIDALAHIDYTLGLLTYNYQSPKTIMAGEYLRWRVDEEKKGERARFPAFIAWLKVQYPDTFARLPLVWKRVYDPEDPAEYRSFRIVLDSETRQPIAPSLFYRMIEEFFDKEFLKSLYDDASLSMRFGEFLKAGSG